MIKKKIVQVEGITCEALLAEMEKRFKKLLSEMTSQKEAAPNEDTYLTIKDVAKMFGVSRETIHSWINTGILKSYKIGRQTRFLTSEVKQAAVVKKSTP